MQVFKFGGTSVGSPERMHKVAHLVTKNKTTKIVVLSAISGTTNALVKIGNCLMEGKQAVAKKEVASLRSHYDGFIKDLYGEEAPLHRAVEVLNKHFSLMEELCENAFTTVEEKILLAQGELLSTQLFHHYTLEQGHDAVLLSALDFMSITADEEPDIEKIGLKLSALIKEKSGHHLYITQGYICLNHLGDVDNLKRGGSDYTASLIGAAIAAEEVQIWTDIDGMHNNDPRVVDETHPIANLTFDEAAELAYFGAKILHPSSILPAQKYKIPVRLKSTIDDKAQGTLISADAGGTQGTVKALAAKDQITAIKIKSSRMLLAYGFLRKIFEVFEKYKTSIDMITTSEVAVSLTIDDDTYLGDILGELNKFGLVDVDTNQTIVCIVGHMVSEEKGVLKKVFDSVVDIPVRMISFGGSRNNISILVDSSYKERTLKTLNEDLFSKKVLS